MRIKLNKLAFVTGAAGFLGRNLVQALLEDQWCVHVLLRNPAPLWMQHDSLKIHQGSLEDEAALMKAMPSHPDAVFHVAGNTSTWTGDEKAIYRDNVTATKNVLQAAIHSSARRMVMTSTAGIFNPHAGSISESTAFKPLTERNPYLRTKLLADALLTASEAAGLSVVSLHPGHILGKFDRTGWGSLFDEAANGKMKLAPSGRASFCSVRSVALAHLAAAKHASPARRYALGGEDASYLDMFAAVARLVNAKPVTSTVPNVVIQSMALLAQAISCISHKRPSITPGLANILVSDLLVDSRLAESELGYQRAQLTDMLDETHACWAARRMNEHACSGIHR